MMGKVRIIMLITTLKFTYEVNDFASVYGGVSTGFKASAWNISRDSRPTANEINALAAAGTPVGPNTTVGRRYAILRKLKY